ncbi:OsmC family protein [Secundilactobacillus mixtipabuli]|uniref:OsmC family protein n=1 Tax=Secundilactobacillus mixtipabuli TaxID=1435342 RepID=A0A1Z5IEM6_9LACO|nr:OsmC family protein [Secundilactobacillus mixtipabuli]GAW99900.1 OsmC family protein [Secundilactobacillus mixtipabuli]
MPQYTASARKTNSSLQVDVHSRGIHTTIDEPVNSGGTNTGMNPVELELCSLGSSLQDTAMKLASKNGFNYQELNIDLEGDLDPAGFMGDPDIRNGFQEIRYKLIFKTNESPEKSQNFADLIKQNCPIEQLLSNGIPVKLNGIEIN